MYVCVHVLAYHIAHAQAGHLVDHDLGHTLEIIQRTGGDATKEDLLGGATSQQDTHPVTELGRGHDGALLRKVLRVAESRRAARHDRHLQQGVRMLQEPANHGVARLVVGHRATLLRREDARPALQATDDTLDGLLKVSTRHRGSLVPSRNQGRLIAYVGDIGTGEGGSQGGKAGLEEGRRGGVEGNRTRDCQYVSVK